MYTLNEEKPVLPLEECRAKFEDLETVYETEMHHCSDGTELIPAEVQAQTRRNDSQSLAQPMVAGYTVDDEGLISAYSIEPVMYADEEQRAGFTVYAERLNGRLAMIGFVSLLAVEMLTGHSFLWWLANG
jgi:hypothetical protein